MWCCGLAGGGGGEEELGLGLGLGVVGMGWERGRSGGGLCGRGREMGPGSGVAVAGGWVWDRAGRRACGKGAQHVASALHRRRRWAAPARCNAPLMLRKKPKMALIKAVTDTTHLLRRKNPRVARVRPAYAACHHLLT